MSRRAPTPRGTSPARGARAVSRILPFDEAIDYIKRRGIPECDKNEDWFPKSGLYTKIGWDITAKQAAGNFYTRFLNDLNAIVDNDDADDVRYVFGFDS